jgi:hypothetical protein
MTKSDSTKSPFHPDNLRLDVGEVQAVIPRKIKWRREHFTQVPGIWKDRLTKVRYISTYRVALHVLMRDFETRGKPFTLSNSALALENVSRLQKWHALSELEAAGDELSKQTHRRQPASTVHVPRGRACAVHHHTVEAG